MLSTMRKNLKSLSWTLWLVILAFVGFIFVEWGAGRLDGFGGESDLLSINGEVIEGEEFSKDLFRTLENYKQQFKDNFNVSIINQLRLPEQILQTLINKTIISQEASQADITASNQELKEKIVNLPGFQRNGEFIGVKEYQRFLNYRRINIKDFENQLKQEIILDKFKELVTNGLVIGDQALWEAYRKEKDSAEIQYLILKPDVITRSINPGEDELKKFYNRNKQQFKTPEKRAGAFIYMGYEDMKKKITIPRQELYDYFKNNKKMFVTPEKIRVSRLFLPYNQENREEILKKAERLAGELNPDNFSDMAKRHSQDEKAAAGGDWGYWEWKNFTRQEQGFITGMKEKEISPPIDTSEGFSLIFISEKTAQKQDTFDEAKDRIKQTLEQEKSHSRVRAYLEDIHEKLESGEDIRSGIGGTELEVRETGWLTPGEPVEKIDEMGAISRKLFDLQKNDIAFPVELRQGMAILQLSGIKRSHIEEFEKVKDAVKDEYIRHRKMSLLSDYARNMVNTLSNMPDDNRLSRYLKKKNLGFEDFSYKRGNKLDNLPEKRNLDETVFSLDENQYAPPIEYESEIAIIRLKSKQVVDKNQFENEKEDFYQTQIQEKKDNYFATYVMDKRNNAKIKFNQELYKKIKDYVISRF